MASDNLNDDIGFTVNVEERKSAETLKNEEVKLKFPLTVNF